MSIKYEDEIKYVMGHPGVNHTDAARDAYMEMTRRPIPRMIGTISSSTDPSAAPEEQSIPSTEIRKKPAPDEATRQRKRGPTINEQTKQLRQLLPNKMPPLLE